MEWLRIKTSTLFVRVAIDEIVYVKADGNYCDLVLINGRVCKMTFQLNFFEKYFMRLKSADWFIRVGRSLIVNRIYVKLIDLNGQTIIFGGRHVVKVPNAADLRPKSVNEALNSSDRDLYILKVPRDPLKELKDRMDNIKGD